MLRWAEPYMRPGTLIYFDEFYDRDHEGRAFSEWQARSQHRLKPLGFAEGGACWLFEVTSLTQAHYPDSAERLASKSE